MLWKTVGAVCRRGVGVAPEVVGVMVVRGWGMSRGVRHGGARSVAVGGFSVAGSFLRLSTLERGRKREGFSFKIRGEERKAVARGY